MNIDLPSYRRLGFNKYGKPVGSLRVDGKLCQVVDNEDSFAVAGFVGRYKTSTKPWMAHVTVYKDGRTFARFGRDERSGRFNKMAGISYEPATYATLANADYWDAV